MCVCAWEGVDAAGMTQGSWTWMWAEQDRDRAGRRNREGRRIPGDHDQIWGWK